MKAKVYILQYVLVGGGHRIAVSGDKEKHDAAVEEVRKQLDGVFFPGKVERFAQSEAEIDIPVKVVVGIENGQFRGASATHAGIVIEAFDWDAAKQKAFDSGTGDPDIADDGLGGAEDDFAKLTEGMVVLC